VSPGPPRDDLGAVAGSMLDALRDQVHDLRALTFGLGGVILAVWIFAGVVSAGGPLCCRFGSSLGLDFEPGEILSALIGAALLLSTVGIWTARTRDYRALREEWRALSIDPTAALSAHFLERTGAWREANRRNLEAAMLSGILLPLATFWVTFSTAIDPVGGAPASPWIPILGLTVSCEAFAFLQVGAILLSGRTAVGRVDRERVRLLETISLTGQLAGSAKPFLEPDPGGAPSGEDRLRAAESTLAGREQDARRVAARETDIGVTIVLATALGLAALLAVSLTALSSPAQSGFLAIGPDYTTGESETGIVIALVGFGGVLWAAARLWRAYLDSTSMERERPGSVGASGTLVRLDEAVRQLDRARTTASRCRNAMIFATVLIVVRFWFFPFDVQRFVTGTAVASSLLANLALPLALAVTLWTAYRMDRVERLQMELRQWVSGLVRLEQAFWDSY
jgi:hypothetical protein